jgi:cell fate (sporulation/competence/biofilm development) regulator YmcA (YheA/YmcA/DUF963 family)
MTVQRVEDFREIQLGTKTAQGTVKHIYGAVQNFIVFLSDTDEIKCLSEREDKAYQNATIKRISLQIKKKLKG